MTVAVRSQPNPNFNINDNIATGVNTDIGVVGSDYYYNSMAYNERLNSTSGNDFVASSGHVSTNTTAVPSDTSQLNSGNQKTDLTAMVAERDRDFVLNAASGGIYEVQAGQKAVAKSSNSNVKDLGQHMIDDHSASNKELLALAQRKGIKVSTLPDADKIALLGKLDGLNGSDFDREYLKQQQLAHQETIAKFEAAANSAADRDIRDWAAGTLPKLRDHLAMINSDLSGLPNTNIGSEKP